MKKRILIYVVLLFIITNMLMACTHKKQVSVNNNIMNCVLLGYDSIAHYYGSSEKMTELKRGNTRDSLFMNDFLQSAKEHAKNDSFRIVIKPTASADVIKTTKEIIDLLNQHALTGGRMLDTLDENEQKFFNTISLQDVVQRMNAEPLKLNLPKDENQQEPLSKGAIQDRVVVLFYGTDGIYIYTGSDINSGEKLTSKEFNDFLQAKKTNKKLWFLLKASENATYNNTVDMLDFFTQNKIEQYSLVDISKDEQAFLDKIK